MNKSYSTDAIVLKKIPFGNYDEKILFLTKDFGKILLMSYGSRSHRSRRRVLLHSLDFIKIYFNNANSEYYLLEKVELIFCNSYLLQGTKNYLIFTNFLKKILQVFPLQEVATKDSNSFFILFYFLIKNYILQKCKNTKVLFFMLHFSLLKFLGIFPYFHDKIKNEEKIKTNQLYFFLNQFIKIIKDKKQKKYNFYDEKYQQKIFSFFYHQYSIREKLVNQNSFLAKKILINYMN